MSNQTALVQAFESLTGAVPSVIAKLVVAVIILLAGFIIGRIAGKLIYKALHEFELNNSLKKAGMNFNLEEIAKYFVSYLIYFIAVIWALAELGLSTIVLTIIFSAVIIILIVAFLIGIKDFIPNTLAGLSVSRKGLIKEGCRIKINGIEGKIKKINLAETEIITKNKDIIIIPNSSLKKQAVIIKKRN